MSDLWPNIVVILLLILVAGCFVAAELALISLREGQVTRLAQDGGRRGKRLARLTKNPNRFLAAGQIGVTLAGFISAAYGEAQARLKAALDAAAVAQTELNGGMLPESAPAPSPSPNETQAEGTAA